LIGLVHWNM